LKTYKPADVGNYKLIASEVLSCLSDLPDGNKFFIRDTDYFKQNCPALCSYLKSINLYDRWNRTGISKLDAGGRLPLHSDGRCRCALNVPILNCGDSYTIWYSAEVADSIKPVMINGAPTDATYIAYQEECAIEIDRVCSDQPLWVNVQTPHTGINYSDKTRMVLTLRFDPELDDIFNK
jgi:hypothetical protein